MKFTRYLITILLSLALLTSCHQKEKKEEKQLNIVTATMQSRVTRLYFSGVLKPLQDFSVVSPVDGHVDKINFEYGQKVKKGQILFLLNSSQLASDFQQAVTDYLQSKDAYLNGIQSYQGSVALYKAQVLSKEDFVAAKNEYENNVIKYYTSKFKLEQILKQVNLNPAEIEKLSLGDTAAVSKILHMQFNNIQVTAPADGIVLFPLSDSGDQSKDSSGKLTVGSEVKTGQLLLTIGNLAGLAVQIQVSEVNVTQIKVGTPATITGDAFPKTTLAGQVVSVASQASPDQGGGSGGSSLSQFNVQIIIPKITAEQLKQIRVGMTAKIEIDITEKPSLTLPIEAVFQKEGQSMVTLIDANGKQMDVPVITGETGTDSVVIAKGLKAGDRVVVH